MNRKDIICMAREARFYVKDDEAYSPSNQEDHELTEYLERFAVLVASAEREACAKIVEESSLPDAYSQECMPDIANDIRARGQA